LIHGAIRESLAFGWLSRMLATTATRLTPTRLVRIRAAELLVWGEDDVFRTVDYAERFANSIQRAGWFVFDQLAAAAASTEQVLPKWQASP